MRRHKNLSEKTTDYVYEIGLQITERPDEDDDRWLLRPVQASASTGWRASEVFLVR